MLSLSLCAALVLAASDETADTAQAVSADGGEVPIVAPTATPSVGPVLAPELFADGGVQVSDAGVAELVSRPSLSVYQVDFPSEVVITATTLGVVAMVELIQPSLEGDQSCRNGSGATRCAPNELLPIDRYSVGKQSAAWKLASDASLYFAIGLPIAYLALESIVLPTQTPFRDFFTDALVMAESMALTQVLVTVLKYSFRRPRPSRYLPVDPDPVFDHELSLPSGHTAMVTAATTAFTTSVFLRHPRSPLRWVALGFGIALSTLAGLGRIENGNHFFTDVAAGAFVGGFSGFVVPYWHRKQLPVVPRLAMDPSTGAASVGVTGTF